MRKLLPLYAVLFIAFLGISMSILIFTEFTMNVNTSPLAKSLTFAKRSLLFGLLTSVYPLGQFFGSPPLGALSDRYGRRPILIGSLIFTTLCYVLVSLSLNSVAIFWICLSLFLAGLGEANIAIAQGAIADLADQKNRTHLFGYVSVVISSAYIVGPILGGALSDTSKVAWFNVATPYWAVTFLLIATIFWVFFGFQETQKKENRSSIAIFQAITQLKTVFTDKDIRPFYLVNFLAYTAIFGYFRFFPLYIADQYQPASTLLAYVIAWVSIPIITINCFLIKPLVKRYTLKQLYEFSLWMIALGSILTVIFKPFGYIWLTTFFTTLFIAIALTVSISALSNRVGPSRQGRVLGNNLSLEVIPQVLVGFLGGALSMASVKFPLISCAIFAIIGALISIKLEYAESH